MCESGVGWGGGGVVVYYVLCTVSCVLCLCLCLGGCRVQVARIQMPEFCPAKLRHIQSSEYGTGLISDQDDDMMLRTGLRFRISIDSTILSSAISLHT